MAAHTIIIAEAGVNHNGSLEMALQLIDKAAEAGADYVKFQTFKASCLVSKQAKKAQYQKENMPEVDDSQEAMLRRLELSESDHKVLMQRCEERNIKFLSTAFDLESVDFLASLGLNVWKIPSGEITNLPYLRKIAHQGGNIIISTGMCELEEVKEAINVFVVEGVNPQNITLLHCNTQYPTPMDDVNLNAMKELRLLGCGAVGYSDHTTGIEIPIAAVAMGATVIEKHFTLDNTLPGPDHRASLEPDELSAMVSAIRNIEKAMGDGRKRVTTSERENIAVARKSIVAAVEIKQGELLTAQNLTVKRPGTGLSPMLWDKVIGTVAVKDFNPDDAITLD